MVHDSWGNRDPETFQTMDDYDDSANKHPGKRRERSPVFSPPSSSSSWRRFSISVNIPSIKDCFSPTSPVSVLLASGQAILVQKSVACDTGDQPVIIPYLPIASGNVTEKKI